jgi:signal transduction histidine kinase
MNRLFDGVTAVRRTAPGYPAMNVWTSQEGLLVTAEVTQGQEGSLAGTPLVHLSISDEGIGISEEDQKRIFQQYFRTDSAKEMASGTGLGLAITKSLIELQGGKIWFESEYRVGTTFHITVPVAEG